MTEPTPKCFMIGRSRICDNDAREPHTCPYLTDVHDGEPGCDRLCTCCDECTQECADDI